MDALNLVATALLESATNELTETVPLVFQKPLDREKSLMIDLITDRYEGAGAAQFLKVENDDTVTLHVPKVIRRVPAQLGRAS